MSAAAPIPFVSEHYRAGYKQYPEDPPGEELAETARVWQIYGDEARELDREMIDEYKESIDILLVFVRGPLAHTTLSLMSVVALPKAGLFSAVATSFITQAYQSTQTDYAQVAALLLSVVVREQFNNSALIPTIPSHQSLMPTSTDYLLIVNRLWYCSLILSLITALFGILAKQWLIAYRLPSKARSPKEWAQWRQFRFDGFEGWQVPVIISIMPFLLHLSLLLFAIGLVVFLQPFDRISWAITLAFLSFASVMYLLATLLPVLFPDCPYRTRLFEFVRNHATTVLKFVRSHMKRSFFPISTVTRPYDFETSKVAAQSNALTARALSWLGTTSPPNEVFMAILRAVGAAVPGEPLTTHFRQFGIDTLITESLRLQHLSWHCDDPVSNQVQIAAEEIPLKAMYLRALINCTRYDDDGIDRRAWVTKRLGVLAATGTGRLSVEVALFPPDSFSVDDWRTQLGCRIALPLPDCGSQMSDEKIAATLSIASMDDGLLRYLLDARVEWSVVRCRHLFHILSVTPMENIYAGVSGMILLTELLYKRCSNIAPLLPHVSEVIAAVERVQGQRSTFPLHLKWDNSGS
jgi:hypothetical protein